MAVSENQAQHPRREQMFPVLGAGDIERLKRFGEPRRYEAGARIFGAGEYSPGLIVVLGGLIEITQNDGVAGRSTIIKHGPNQFAGELAQLSETMSRYLVDRISSQDNIEVMTQVEVTALGGDDGHLRSISLTDSATGTQSTRPVEHLFLFIGAEPNTGWLASSGIALDDKGFVITGAEAGAGHHLLETSRAGVFAIGDVRCGSIKRVAAAVGEGAQVVAAIHGRFARHGNRPAR